MSRETRKIKSLLNQARKLQAAIFELEDATAKTAVSHADATRARKLWEAYQNIAPVIDNLIDATTGLRTEIMS